MSGPSLYQISEQYRALEQLANTDLPPEVVRDTLEGLQGNFHDKAVSVAHFIRNLEATADAINEAVRAMCARADRLLDRAESLRNYLLFHMQATQITHIDSPYFVLSVRSNPPAVVVDHESLIPEHFWVQPAPPPRRVDRISIAKAFKAGAAVDGCHIEIRQRLDIAV